MVSIAASSAIVAQAQLQMALAAKFAKMNASSQQSIVQLVEAAAANAEALAGSAVQDGIGVNLDTTA